MTVKQKQFVKKYLEYGGNGTQAALAVYDTQNSRTAQSIATENLSKPVIKKELDRLLEREGLNLSSVTSNIAALANSKVDKVSGDTKLKANIELLKLHSAYPDKVSKHFNLSLKAELEKLSYQELVKRNQELDEEIKELIATSEMPISLLHPKTIS